MCSCYSQKSCSAPQCSLCRHCRCTGHTPASCYAKQSAEIPFVGIFFSLRKKTAYIRKRYTLYVFIIQSKINLSYKFKRTPTVQMSVLYMYCVISHRDTLQIRHILYHRRFLNYRSGGQLYGHCISEDPFPCKAYILMFS